MKAAPTQAPSRRLWPALSVTLELIGGSADQNSGRTEAPYFPIRLLHVVDYVNRILKGTKPPGHAADQVRAGDQPSAGLGDYLDSAMVYCQTEKSLGTA